MNEAEFVEARFRILDCMPVGVFVLRDDLTVIFWNRCLEQWTKISRDDILGQKFDSHFYTLNKPLLRVRLQTVFEGGPPAIFSSQLHQYVIPVPLRTGAMRAQHTIVSAVRAPEPGKHYALFAVQDVTDLTIRIQDYLVARQQADAELEERKRVEEALRQQKELLQSVLESLTSRIAVLDHQGKIVGCNGAWQRFAVEHAETLGIGADYLQSFLAGADGQRQKVDMYEGLKAVLDGGADYYQQEYECHISGPDTWYIMTVTPMVGGSQGAVVSHVDITGRKLAEQQVEYLALHDNLTSLPNRQLFVDRINQGLAQAKRRERQLAIMYCDLDDFKLVNDTFGHEVGDAVLVEVARRLIASVRESDTVARIGGDEFALVLDIAKANDAAIVAKKISQALCAPICYEEHKIQVGASIGISLFPKDGSEIAKLLKCADSAMYAVKNRGKSAYGFYS